MFAMLSTEQEEIKVTTDNQENQYLSDIGKLNVNASLPKKSLIDQLKITNKNHAKALMYKNIIRLLRNPG